MYPHYLLGPLLRCCKIHSRMYGAQLARSVSLLDMSLFQLGIRSAIHGKIRPR